MAVLKCKMCGGDMNISPDKTFGTCEYCGSTMTLPKIDDEQRAEAFNRGNHFRRIGEFDKALSVYEHIVEENPNDAEAHWCCALCRFGIEWVEDPVTMEYLPTCHRASFDIFTKDVDYLAAVELSDGITQKQYKKDAAKIFEVQKGLLATSQNERPFDVFICYKESDENGNRTVDSTLAQDIYYQLTDKNLRVFFAKITLEDKIGSEYEPYIFAALNSAKVMVVVGTKPEHFNAVWVKNEWSRFLSIVKHDRSKVILPCYKDMDPYDLPEQLSVLQSYDMSKIGFIQDLIRGIDKVVSIDKKEVKNEPVIINNSKTNTSPLLKRAFLFLEDENWQEADEYCEKVLDIDPENAYAYLGKLMAELHIKKQEHLKSQKEPFNKSNNYQKAVRFGDIALKKELSGYIKFINERNEKNRLTEIYCTASVKMGHAKSENDYNSVAQTFNSISDFKNSKVMAEKCRKRADELKQERLKREEEERIERDRIAEINRIAAEKAAKKRKKVIAIAAPVLCACIVFVILLVTVIMPAINKHDFISKYGQKTYDMFGLIEKGSVIKFGTYEQDNDNSNGAEDIEWQVLDIKDNKALVISRYALDCQQYNTSYTDVTWETCSLRLWLNSNFLDTAFSEKEQAIISDSTVYAQVNPKHSTDPGNDTTDKVFLLSIEEAYEYFSLNEERICVPTAHAVANGAYISDRSSGRDIAGCWWWLRSPGHYQTYAAYVYISGFVYENGYDVSGGNYAVRPAIWIDLSAK